MTFPRGRELFYWAGSTKERDNVFNDITRECSVYKQGKAQVLST